MHDNTYTIKWKQMLILTDNDSQMFQSCQHVLFRVQHFLCRFPDISMRFFWEHSEMFWRANVNLQLIPSVMGGPDRLTEQTALWLARKRDELGARGAFLQRRSDKRKRAGRQPSSVNYTPLWRSANMAEDATWTNTFIDARDIQRSHVIWGRITAPNSTGQSWRTDFNKGRGNTNNKQ